jgi:hypothetical protein
MVRKRKHHFVVVKKSDGSPDKQPMKLWLSQNPNEVPKGSDPHNDISHQLRRALNNNGWELVILTDCVLVIKPDENGDTTYADALREEHAEMAEDLEEEELLEEAEEIAFGLERDMQSALRANIEQLETGLKIIDGGKERITDAGRIDITASDTKNNVVIIELKANAASPKDIAQILAYMGAVEKSDKKPVRGILVANDFHTKAILASRPVPTLLLKKYTIRFTFVAP